MSTFLSIVLLSLCLISLSEATGKKKPLDCRSVRCARPLCANPVTPPGECCPSCENSNCKFKGCVNFLPDGGVQWAETPCIFCRCDKANNQQFCAIIDCIRLTKEDCFGYPVVTRPNECCPSCDFGVPETTCRLVPQIFGAQNITVSSKPGFNSCTKQIQKRGCDKFAFRKGNKKFRCQPKQGKRLVRFGKTCPLCVGAYTDTVRCTPVKDNSVVVGCDLIVD